MITENIKIIIHLAIKIYTPLKVYNNCYTYMLMHSYEKHEALSNLDLWESYVLDWRNENSNIYIIVDAVLLPGHPDYSAPKENEWACYKKSVLTFIGVSNLNGYEKLLRSKPAIGATGEQDFGHIEEFSYDKLGNVEFTIECAGSISLKSKEIIFGLENV